MHRDGVPIQHPCQADWSAMEPRPEAGPSARFCSECQAVVHDLSALSAPEAAALLERPAPPCVRYTAQPDGSIRHRPAPRSRRARLLAMAGLVASVPVLGAWYSFDDAQPPAWLTWLRVQLGIEAPAHPTLIFDGAPDVFMGMPPAPPPSSRVPTPMRRNTLLDTMVQAPQLHLERQVRPVVQPGEVSRPVRALVKIDEHGVPKYVHLLGCPEEVVDRATHALYRWRWSPPVVDGVARSVTTVVEVPLQIEQTD